MNRYQRWHDQIIGRAFARRLNCYSEWHHILPRSLGGSDNSFNLVQLTYREHFLVHWLLTKIHNVGVGKKPMLWALWCMGAMTPGQRTTASWRFEVAKRAQKLSANENNLRRAKILAAKCLRKIVPYCKASFDCPDGSISSERGEMIYWDIIGEFSEILSMKNVYT